VPYSQAELSARCGYARNDGRVYAYLRDLTAGGVVECRRDLVLFDVDRLTEMERAVVVRPLTPRSVEVGRILTETFGRPTADGTIILELGATSSRPGRPARLADMSAVLGINRSSVHRHVRALRSQARLADQRPHPWRLTAPSGGADERAERSGALEQLVEVQAGLVEALSTAHGLRDEQERLYQLLASGPDRSIVLQAVPDDAGAAGADERAERSGVLEDLVEVQAGLVEALSTAHGLRDEQERLYQLLARGPAPSAPGRRAQLGANEGGESADQPAGNEEKTRKDSQSSSLFFSRPGTPQRARTAPGPATGAPKMARSDGEGPAPSSTTSPSAHLVPDWSVDELPAMCVDLMDACERLGLQGANNWAGLAAALAGYCRSEVIAAQRLIVNDVSAKRPISNPFGLLAKVADANHPQHRTYFRPQRPQARARVPSAIDEPNDGPNGTSAETAPADLEADAAVSALEAAASPELDAVDKHVRTTTYRLMPRIFDLHLPDQARHAARATAWRTLHPSPTPEPSEPAK
jgi:hypothetical protein